MATRAAAAKSVSLSVLKAVMKFVSALRDEEVEALASGSAAIAISIGFKGSQRTGKPYFRTAGQQADLDRLRKELEVSESTRAGLALLEEVALTRAELERMARSLELPVTKHDSVSRLEEKIVEALIGARLNSRAVRGES